jgi:enoyl-CoA hydratase/carnithine racemase
MPLSAGLSYETAAFGVVGATQDKLEGMTAFIEKRKPVWKGA